MTNGFETIGCEDARSRNGAATKTVANEKKPVARTRAELQAYQAAYEEAWVAAKRFRCDSECPEVLLRIKVPMPEDQGCTPGTFPMGGMMRRGYECKARCAWELLVRCGTHKLPQPHHHHAEDQKLKCDERDEVADASGKVGPFTSTGATSREAERGCLTKLMDAIKDAVLTEVLRVTCPDRCYMEMAVVVGKPQIHCTTPGAAENWTCTCECEWYVEIRCKT